MGAGASSGSSELDELVACTFLLGQALASMRFPDMHRIEEFGRSFGEGEEELGVTVRANGNCIVVKDVTYANEDGWTALHACCHSRDCVEAALEILKKENAPVEAKTRRGPGIYNSKWTALHMACAYGIEPIARALIEKGADVDCVNSAQWTPLLECCHRGFASLVALLVPRTRQLARIPDDSKSTASPFARPPSQSCLGEACRCGFEDIAGMLLDAGAPKDLQNAIGWTPLHEACFHNHPDCVKLLMVYGADPSIADKQSATPFDVAAHLSTKNLVADLGGAPSGESVASAPKKIVAQDEEEEGAYLHRGERLGDLPAFDATNKQRQSQPSSKTKKSAQKQQRQESAPPPPPEDAPREFLCEISQWLLCEPVRTPYGNVFEAKVIKAWFAKNGSICPLTGQPLVSSELLADKDLRAKITKWQLAKNLDSMSREKNENDDDENIYDF